MDCVARAGLFVEIVDVLRAEKQTVTDCALQSGQREVAGIRLHGTGFLPAHRIKLPHELRILLPRAGMGDFFGRTLAPDAARAPECGQPAFSADACAGEDEDAIVGRDLNHPGVMSWQKV